MVARAAHATIPRRLTNMSSFKVNSAGQFLVKNGHVCTTCCKPGKAGILHLIYQWTAASRDLDTCTTFLGGVVGWNCGGSAPYLNWTSGDNQQSGPETVEIDLLAAMQDGHWTDSVEILCAAGWYEPAGGSGGATIIATYNGVTLTLSTPTLPSQRTCASNPVARIVVLSDGTFTLNPP